MCLEDHGHSAWCHVDWEALPSFGCMLLCAVLEVVCLSCDLVRPRVIGAAALAAPRRHGGITVIHARLAVHGSEH